jgi:hypothetical protein
VQFAMQLQCDPYAESDVKRFHILHLGCSSSSSPSEGLEEWADFMQSSERSRCCSLDDPESGQDPAVDLTSTHQFQM